MTQGKPKGKFINLSEDWELDYCLEKYGYSKTPVNRERLTQMIKESIKPYFGIDSAENLSWDQIDEYYNLHPKGLFHNKGK